MLDDAERFDRKLAAIESSWVPSDLAAIIAEGLVRDEPSLFSRADGKKLLYEGKLNVLFGAPESGKSMIATLIAAEEVNAAVGRGDRDVVVVCLDFEDSPETYLSRLRDAGVDLGAAARLTRHYSLTTSIVNAPSDLDGMSTARVVVVDTTNSEMAFGGLNPLDQKDASTFIQNVREFRATQKTKAAIVLVDHEPTTAGSGRRNALGAVAKFAAIDGVQYRVRAAKQPRPGKGGTITLSVTKDRIGSVRAHAADPDEHGIQLAAVIQLDPIGKDTEFLWTVYEPDETRRHDIRDAIIEILRDSPSPTTSQLKEEVRNRGVSFRNEAYNAERIRLQVEGRIEGIRKGAGTRWILRV